MRKAAQFAGAAAIAAMLLSGCGSSGDNGKESAPSKQPEAGTSTPDSDKPADSKTIEGAWTTKSADGQLILAISKGTVALSNGHKAACIGKIQEMAGMTMAALKCTDGDTTRTMGTLKSGSDGNSLTINWKNGPTEKYTKSTDGKVKIPDMPQLPSGVPDGS